jgi:hypothetical protein
MSYKPCPKLFGSLKETLSIMFMAQYSLLCLVLAM